MKYYYLSLAYYYFLNKNWIIIPVQASEKKSRGGQVRSGGLRCGFAQFYRYKKGYLKRDSLFVNYVWNTNTFNYLFKHFVGLFQHLISLFYGFFQFLAFSAVSLFLSLF